MPKPFSPAELLAKVRELVDERGGNHRVTV
jgi:DNA-binding response OmpR family regulator